jgi:retinol dehydrogenase-14
MIAGHAGLVRGVMDGRAVLVTGGTAGIGLATALGLARLGAHVAIIARTPTRTDDAVRQIDAAGDGRTDVFVADMADQAEVRRLAAEVLDRMDTIDVLINNVGGYWHTRHVTADGLERTFAVNHLASFLLTNLLLDRLGQGPSRVVNVASRAHVHGRIDFDDLQGERSYSGASAYSQSKLANILFTYELARRLRHTSITVNALHPGVVNTGLGAADPGGVQRWLVPLLRPVMRSTAQGALTSIRVASDPGLQHATGEYHVGRGTRQSSGPSRSRATASRLWRVSTDLTVLSPRSS